MCGCPSLPAHPHMERGVRLTMRVCDQNDLPLMRPAHGAKAPARGSRSAPRASGPRVDDQSASNPNAINWGACFWLRYMTGRRACWGSTVLPPIRRATARNGWPATTTSRVRPVSSASHNRTLLRHHSQHQYRIDTANPAVSVTALPAFVTTWLGTRLLRLAVRAAETAQAVVSTPSLAIVQASREHALTVVSLNAESATGLGEDIPSGVLARTGSGSRLAPAAGRARGSCRRRGRGRSISRCLVPAACAYPSTRPEPRPCSSPPPRYHLHRSPRKASTANTHCHRSR
jgi:hypothetical protein